ncbi:hypothetical protein OH76DRAFT_902096 [Lentinus brumalis]|uniref:Secreted protein n=1 Tax=Lentinus brumalis TaxID=2498619 RepID=A0A371D137_9APHY|nr:hypothetical protein OH76DRAFT_902096 [Polyporus brumalis]
MTPSNWSLIFSCVHILCLGTSPSRSSVLRHAVINYSHCRLPRPRNNCGQLHFIKRLLSYVLRGAFNVRRSCFDWGTASSPGYKSPSRCLDAQ